MYDEAGKLPKQVKVFAKKYKRSQAAIDLEALVEAYRRLGKTDEYLTALKKLSEIQTEDPEMASRLPQAMVQAGARTRPSRCTTSASAKAGDPMQKSFLMQEAGRAAPASGATWARRGRLRRRLIEMEPETSRCTSRCCRRSASNGGRGQPRQRRRRPAWGSDLGAGSDLVDCGQGVGEHLAIGARA